MKVYLIHGELNKSYEVAQINVLPVKVLKNGSDVFKQV